MNKTKTGGDAATLGERLRQERKNKGWTQAQLAERADTTQAVIQKIENAKSLRPRKIDAIAHSLGVSPSWLMFGSESDETLDREATAIARAWSKLKEPARSALKEAILQLESDVEANNEA